MHAISPLPAGGPMADSAGLMNKSGRKQAFICKPTGRCLPQNAPSG
jgi:hypothetical protein